MIRHIVQFKLKDFATEALKMEAVSLIKNRLDELPLKIGLIRRYEAGIDIRKSASSFDIVIVMDFDSLADLDAYTTHPVHQEFVAFNKDSSVAKASVDYEKDN